VEQRDGAGYAYRYFMALDIKDHYPSIEASRLEEFLTGKLPREMIRNVVTNLEREKDIRTSHTEDPSDISGPHSALLHRALAISGLAQGSACSSLVAAMVVKWALDRSAVPERARRLNYADNIIVVGATREDVEATYLSLRSLLRTSPVGRLELRREPIGRVDERFEWLGYRVERRPNGMEVRPTEERIEEFETEVRARLVEIAATRGQPLRSVRLRDGFVGYVRSWTASYRVKDDDGRPIADARPTVLAICDRLMVELAPQRSEVGTALRIAARSLSPGRVPS
jgi:hypothetical protein